MVRKATAKPINVDYVVWGDNLSEMKHFCGDRCSITYETCSVDDFWLLTVDDDIKDKKVTVPLGHYVVIDELGCLTVMGPVEFGERYESPKE